MKQSNKCHRYTNTNRRKHHSPNVRRDHDPDAYEQGLEAKAGGRSIRSNPYPKGGTAHREWSRGWRKG